MKTLKQKLQVAQNKVVRIILYFMRMTRINYSVLSEINMLKVEDMAKQLKLKIFMRFFHSQSNTVCVLLTVYLIELFRSLQFLYKRTSALNWLYEY